MLVNIDSDSDWLARSISQIGRERKQKQSELLPMGQFRILRDCWQPKVYLAWTSTCVIVLEVSHFFSFKNIDPLKKYLKPAWKN